MDIEVTPLGDECNVVRLSGRLDSPGVDSMETRFTAAVVASGRHALVDLSGVSYIGSLGIGMLIANARALGRKGRRIALFGASEPVQHIIESVALDQIIPVAVDQQAAVTALNA